ncbi:hypothetical protein PENTCL1PPCAC_29312 [Pristionchus entomophagus]|uniref:Peptidase S1 domain-containing protein n=1 Tax=Pristionchus entomophagus TaxID=358040 RepID=A0AAV5ULF7_9BILA|nr:hypothetical protein PENTCL1PPCAC_29312 [Pristionchus entomophagus]
MGRSQDGKTSKCGGTVLSEIWILTAAHCMTPNTRQIVFGGVSRVEDLNSTDVVRLTAVETKIHYLYNNKSHPNDIALLKLETPLSFNDLVSPICLPNVDQSIPNDGQAVATGYGVANERGTNKTFNDHTLRETILPIGDSGGPLMMKSTDG